MREGRPDGLAGSPALFLDALRGSLLSRTLASAPFVGFMVAYTVSQFSEGMTQTVLTWIAFRVHHDDIVLVGRIGILQTIIPFLILIPVGIMVDALPRSMLMAGINLFKGATYAVIPLLSLFEPLRPGLLILVVVATAVLSAGFGPALNASIPGFVPSDRLKHGNGWVQIAAQGGYFLGPLVTAGLLLYFPAPWLLVLSGGGYVLSAFLFALILPPLPLQAGKGGGKGEERIPEEGLPGVLHSISMVIRSPILVLCSILFMIFGLLNAPMSMVFPLLSAQIYKTPPSFYAMLSGGYFLGSFLGGVVLLGRRLPGHFSMILGGMTLAAGAFLLIPVLTFPWVGAFLLLVAGVGLSWAQPLVLALVQGIVPREALGRILSLVMTLFLLSALLGIEGGTLYLRHHSVVSFLRLFGTVLLPVSLILLLLVTRFRARLSP